MAGRGFVPDEETKKGSSKPRRGWTPAPALQWRHGPTPEPPEGLRSVSVDAWATWFSSWFSAFWELADVPGLRVVIRLYDQVERGEFQRASELRLQMDTYGITPKGQADRRWKPPAVEAVASPSKPRRYRHLAPVNPEGAS